jgi:hypothetical protein
MANINVKLVLTRLEGNRKETTGEDNQNAQITMQVEFLGKYHRVGEFTLAEMRLLLGSEHTAYTTLVNRARSGGVIDSVYSLTAELDFENNLLPWMKKYKDTEITNLLQYEGGE